MSVPDSSNNALHRGDSSRINGVNIQETGTLSKTIQGIWLKKARVLSGSLSSIKSTKKEDEIALKQEDQLSRTDSFTSNFDEVFDSPGTPEDYRGSHPYNIPSNSNPYIQRYNVNTPGKNPFMNKNKDEPPTPLRTLKGPRICRTPSIKLHTPEPSKMVSLAHSRAYELQNPNNSEIDSPRQADSPMPMPWTIIHARFRPRSNNDVTPFRYPGDGEAGDTTSSQRFKPLHQVLSRNTTDTGSLYQVEFNEEQDDGEEQIIEATAPNGASCNTFISPATENLLMELGSTPVDLGTVFAASNTPQNEENSAREFSERSIDVNRKDNLLSVQPRKEASVDVTPAPTVCSSNYQAQLGSGQSVEHVQELMVAADMLEITDVVHVCSNFLKKELHPSNAIGIYRFAEANHLVEMQEAANEFIFSQFAEVVNEDEFLDMPRDILITFFKSEYLRIDSEFQIFSAALRWISQDIPTRRRYVFEILNQVRLPLIPSKLLEKSINDCCDISLKVALRSIQKDLTSKRGSLVTLYVQPRICARKKLYVIGGSNRELISSWTRSECTFESVECFDTFRKEWQRVSPMEIGRILPGIAVLNGNIYVVGGEQESGEVYDPHEDVWTSMAPMVTPRCEFGLCAHGGYLYAFGGWVGEDIGGSIERYDPVADVWRLESNMPEARFSMGVVEYKGLIYIVGGCTHSQRHLHDLLCYNPVTGEWNNLSPMLTPRSQMGVAVLDGYLYVVGGTNRHNVLTSVERYSFGDDKWYECPPMTVGRASPAVAAINSLLYVIGGDQTSEVNDFYRAQDNGEEQIIEATAPNEASCNTFISPATENLLMELGSTPVDLGTVFAASNTPQHNLTVGQVSLVLPQIDTMSTMLAYSCPTSLPLSSCPPSRYRTLDGTCNNPDQPRWGAANTPYLRLLPAWYDDAGSEMIRNIARDSVSSCQTHRLDFYQPPDPQEVKQIELKLKIAYVMVIIGASIAVASIIALIVEDPLDIL